MDGDEPPDDETLTLPGDICRFLSLVRITHGEARENLASEASYIIFISIPAAFSEFLQTFLSFSIPLPVTIPIKHEEIPDEVLVELQDASTNFWSTSSQSSFTATAVVWLTFCWGNLGGCHKMS